MTRRKSYALLEREVEVALGERRMPLAGRLAGTLREARELCEDGRSRSAGELLAAAGLAALATDPQITPEELRRMAATAARAGRLDPLCVGLLALADPMLARSTVDVAVRAHAVLVAGLSAAPAVGIWRTQEAAQPAFVAGAGEAPEDRTRAAVAAVLAQMPPGAPALLVQTTDAPCAVIAWDPAGADAATPLIAARSAEALALPFERAVALGEVPVVELEDSATRRRMTRVALDLHDGPLQDLALLRGELGALRRRLGTAAEAGGAPDGDPLAQLDDLVSVAAAAEADLRELAVSLESTSLGRRPLEEALRGALRSLALRADIEPQLTIRGDPSTLTSAERVAVLRVVGEALANAREHAGATTVDVRVHVGPQEVVAAVHDDGRGFELDRKLPEAAREGRLGLVGMMERMRRMGGICSIGTAPGAGTTVTLRFARFAARERVPERRGA